MSTPGNATMTDDDDGSMTKWLIVLGAVGGFLALIVGVLVFCAWRKGSSGRSKGADQDYVSSGNFPLLEPHDGYVPSAGSMPSLDHPAESGLSAEPPPPRMGASPIAGPRTPEEHGVPAGAATPQSAPSDDAMQRGVDDLLRSRTQGVASKDRKVLILRNAQRIGPHDKTEFLSLAPDFGFALRGEWMTSTGIRLDVSRDGLVHGGDGSTALLLETPQRRLVVRSGQHYALLSDERLAGPAPEVLCWNDKSIWLRQHGPPQHIPSSSPDGLAPGTRIETPSGRGTAVRQYMSEDIPNYWFVRLDKDPSRERLMPSVSLRVLPWFQQDAVLQASVSPATASGFAEYAPEQLPLRASESRQPPLVPSSMNVQSVYGSAARDPDIEV